MVLIGNPRRRGPDSAQASSPAPGPSTLHTTTPLRGTRLVNRDGVLQSAPALRGVAPTLIRPCPPACGQDDEVSDRLNGHSSV